MRTSRASNKQIKRWNEKEKSQKCYHVAYAFLYFISMDDCPYEKWNEKKHKRSCTRLVRCEEVLGAACRMWCISHDVEVGYEYRYAIVSIGLQGTQYDSQKNILVGTVYHGKTDLS